MKVGYEHAELRAPVTDMIHALHTMAHKFKNSADAVADNGLAQVTDMHFLRDVGGRKIHDDVFALNEQGQHSACIHGLHLTRNPPRI